MESEKIQLLRKDLGGLRLGSLATLVIGGSPVSSYFPTSVGGCALDWSSASLVFEKVHIMALMNCTQLTNVFSTAA